MIHELCAIERKKYWYYMNFRLDQKKAKPELNKVYMDCQVKLYLMFNISAGLAKYHISLSSLDLDIQKLYVMHLFIF